MPPEQPVTQLPADRAPVMREVPNAPDAAREVTPRKPARSLMIDVTRAVAGLLIVFCHVNTTTEFNTQGTNTSYLVGTFGVPFYLFAALLFVMIGFAREPQRSLTTYLVGRVKKLYLPFLLWTVLYAGLSAIRNQSAIEFEWYFLWAGSYTHLYFLPMLLACTVVLALVAGAALRSQPLTNWLVAVLVSVGCFAATVGVPTEVYALRDTLDETGKVEIDGLINYARAFPAACWGIAFALYFGRSGRRVQLAGYVAVAGLGLTIGTIVGQLLVAKPGVNQNMLARNLSGLGWMLLALAPWRMSLLAPLAVLGRHSFGIYLVHIAVLRSLVILMESLGLPAGVWGELWLQIAVTSGVYAISFVFSCLVARWPATEWIVGYESSKVRATM